MKINWPNTLFLILTPLAAILGTAYWLYSGQFNASTIYFAFIYLVLSGLAITVGYHRLFSHKAYDASPSVRFILSMLGASLFEGSILDWSTDHRDHHRFTDTERDPYNFQRGFWYAHIGWLIILEKDKRDYNNVNDLKADPMIVWQDKHFKKIATFMGFILPMLIASLWHDPLGGLFIAGALRITLNQHFTFCINSVCHCFGKLRYDDQGSARDHWLTAFFTYGEGYHNFHHKFPVDYRNGIRPFDFDPSKWVIYALYKLGLASNLKRISRRRIIQCRLAIEEKILREQVASESALAKSLSPLIEQARQSVLSTLARLESIESNMKKLKTKNVNSVKLRMKVFKHNCKLCKRELRDSLKAWREVIDQSLLQQHHVATQP